MRKILSTLLLLVAFAGVNESWASTPIATSQATKLKTPRPPKTMSPQTRQKTCKAKCKPKACAGWTQHEWCQKECWQVENINIANCLQVTPIIQNETDANNAGSAKEAKILADIYKEYPLVKPLLDESIPSKSGDTYWDHELLPGETKQLSNALELVGKGCSAIAEQVSSIKSLQPHNSSQPIIDNVNGLSKALQEGIYAVENDENLPMKVKKDVEYEQSRKRVKQAVAENVTLNFKNCMNQGMAAKFQLEQKPSIARDIIRTFGCSHCEGTDCSRSIAVYKKCINRCPTSIITDCVAAAARCPAGPELDQNPASCDSLKNLVVKKNRCAKCTAEVCSTSTGYEDCLKDCPDKSQMPKCEVGAASCPKVEKDRDPATCNSANNQIKRRDKNIAEYKAKEALKAEEEHKAKEMQKAEGKANSAP